MLYIEYQHYSKEALCEALFQEDWNIEAQDPQAYYNIFENKLVNIVDKMAPIKEYVKKSGHNEEQSQSMKRLINKKRKHLYHRRRSGRIEEHCKVSSLK